jgi:hypothetical protein
MITFPLWQEEHHPNTNVFNNQNPKDALNFILMEFEIDSEVLRCG